MILCANAPGPSQASASGHDRNRYIELDDAHIAAPAAVGVSTKADSVTEFKHFSFGQLSR